jgi:hypothetical protein
MVIVKLCPKEKFWGRLAAVAGEPLAILDVAFHAGDGGTS